MDRDLMVSLIKRHMRESPRFVRWDPADKPPGDVPIDAGEIVVGYYENPPPWQSERLTFTSDGLWVTGGATLEKIRWSDVVAFESPLSKQHAESVVVQTSSGKKVVHVAGCHGPGDKFKDSFALVMLLRAIVPR